MAEVSWQVVRLVGVMLVQGPPVAYYVYRKRTRNRESRPLAWGVGVGLFGVVGLLWYMMLRGNLAPD